MTQILPFTGKFRPRIVEAPSIPFIVEAPSVDLDQIGYLADAGAAASVAALDLAEAVKSLAEGRVHLPREVTSGETLTSLLSATLTVLDAMGRPDHTIPLAREITAWLAAEGGGDLEA